MTEQALFRLDLDRCTGCGACVVACSTENEVDPELAWRSIFTFNERRFPWAPVFHYSLACNHCGDPACARGCPAAAYTKDDRTGAVLLDADRCIGCRYCAWVCPYGAPRYDPRARVMAKCTFCQHRLQRGDPPACAVACPVEALGFIDRGQPRAVDRPGLPEVGLRPGLRVTGARDRQRPRLAASPSDDDLPLGAERLRATHLGPEWSLLVFTYLLTLLVSLVATRQVSGSNASPWILATGGVVAYGTSLLHLGRPERAWRALLHVRRSWLSREAAFSGAFLGTAVAAALLGDAGRLLGWIAVACGAAALLSVDMVYRVPGQLVRAVPHSAMTTLTAALLVGVGLGLPWLTLVAALAKLLLYHRRTNGAGPLRHPALAVLRIGVGLLLPLSFWFVVPGANAAPVIVGLLLGEAVDRARFYAELRFLAPQHQIEADLRAMRPQAPLGQVDVSGALTVPAGRVDFLQGRRLGEELFPRGLLDQAEEPATGRQWTILSLVPEGRSAMDPRTATSTATAGRAVLLAAALLATPATGQEPPARDVGLEERVARRLFQLDVTVSGRPEAIADLVASDFDLRIFGKRIESFYVDRLCPPQGDATADRIEQPQETPDIARTVAERAPTSYLLYFDQAFLTQAGRVRALELARDLIPLLVREGSPVTVISSGEVVRTYATRSTDPELLLRTIDEIERDPRQWDPTAIIEEDRIGELQAKLQRFGASIAQGLARQYAADESWRAEKALRRLSMGLGMLATVDPPKAVLYFADRMRSNPGEHYLSFFSETQVSNNASLGNITVGADAGTNAFDRVVDEANAHGARLYTVLAEGMTSMGSITNSYGRGTSGTRHLSDARNGISSLAAETGGKAFVVGERADKIVRTDREDLSCLYLLSFDPADLPRDRGLSVGLRVAREGVELRYRGQIYLQGAAEERTSKLLAAFLSPEAHVGDGTARGAVVPIGFEDGKFAALVQLSVAGSPLDDATWDLGISSISRGIAREDASGRVAVPQPGVPVVFETRMNFAPGPSELVMVAHEMGADAVSAVRMATSWPDPEEETVSFGPIALVQPAAAIFMRDGAAKPRGALGRSDDDALQADLPTAVIALVCRPKRERGSMRIARRLVGENAVDFPDMEVPFADDRCVQIQDVIREGTMTDGEFAYRLRAFSEGVELGSAERTFGVVGADVGAGDAPTTVGAD